MPAVSYAVQYRDVERSCRSITMIIASPTPTRQLFSAVFLSRHNFYELNGKVELINSLAALKTVE